MQRWMHRLIAAVALAVPLALQAQAAAPAAQPESKVAGPPAGFVAPAEPKPDETNAQRAKSQPGNNAPFWRAVKEQQGITSLPGAEKGTLIQPFVDYPGSTFTTAGEAWRQVRNEVIIPYGGALIGIVALAIALFYWRRGSLGGHVADTGRKIERFTPFERAAHWANAIAFTILAISGLVMAFGKFFLLPVIGVTLFGWLTYALKTAHNFAGPVFAVSLVIVILTYVRDNFPQRGDLNWLLRGGGMFGGAEAPSNRFNAGEKLLFWGGVLTLGLIVVGSGLFLDKLVPGFVFTRGEMQIAHMIHSAAAVVMTAMFLGHIYMGTIGMKGAYSAMRTGYVDEAWAREHHEYWADDVRAGKIPAQRSGQSAPGVVKPA
ncbi:MAG: formate dehydrogenase subunit gamma [Aquincola sp.]|nr:formate dehydrogenase subunit gamma [Aquincola sp.]MDH4288854.1 formate dehydrogenase subunit gamma [Aquincola sp.]MDH5331004.1 formate dehydrogenase subunit gamma [Aquincola sp.]